MLDFIGAIIIGAIAGFIAGKITRGRGFGLLGNIIIGVVGGVLGTIILGLFLVQLGGLVGSILKATFGAVILLWLMSFFSGRR